MSGCIEKEFNHNNCVGLTDVNLGTLGKFYVYMKNVNKCHSSSVLYTQLVYIRVAYSLKSFQIKKFQYTLS